MLARGDGAESVQPTAFETRNRGRCLCTIRASLPRLSRWLQGAIPLTRMRYPERPQELLVAHDADSGRRRHSLPGRFGPKVHRTGARRSPFLIALVILVVALYKLHINSRRPGRRASQSQSAPVCSGISGRLSARFPLRTIRWKMLDAQCERRCGPRDGAAHIAQGSAGRTLYLSWFANCVIPAKLGGSCLSSLPGQDDHWHFGIKDSKVQSLPKESSTFSCCFPSC